jgi:biotin-dependent carboxylase-like uncharacterized protein
LHTAPVYRVFLIGFSPGFPYLGPLDSRLHAPRLESPRERVPAGSVAIGGEHTGIYSIASPGGWWLVGRTNTEVFSAAKARNGGTVDAFLLRQGDLVKFLPVEELSRWAVSMTPVLQVVAAGAGLSLQDLGRSGWKRFGIPPGGAMDLASARQANLLVGNDEGAPVLELLFTGAKFRVLDSSELAIVGADVECEWPTWKNFRVAPGIEISFGTLRAGVWSYVAVRGGFVAPRWFGSASVNPRAGFGESIQPGERLACESIAPSEQISSRFVPELVREQYGETPVLRIWRGPEWDGFTGEALRQFLEQTWRVSSQSDRAGYRLEGIALESRLRMPSAPVAVGAIQVPPNGLPIVLLRDGPTVGGYPRLAILDAAGVSRFTQCAPGTGVRFALAE